MSDHSSHDIRARLDHPVIDADGHIIEFLPVVRDFLVEEGGHELAVEFDEVLAAQSTPAGVSIEERRAMGLFNMTWWPYPAEKSRDGNGRPAVGHARGRLPVA